MGAVKGGRLLVFPSNLNNEYNYLQTTYSYLAIRYSYSYTPWGICTKKCKNLACVQQFRKHSWLKFRPDT